MHDSKHSQVTNTVEFAYNGTSKGLQKVDIIDELTLKTNCTICHSKTAYTQYRVVSSKQNYHRNEKHQFNEVHGKLNKLYTKIIKLFFFNIGVPIKCTGRRGGMVGVVDVVDVVDAIGVVGVVGVVSVVDVVDVVDMVDVVGVVGVVSVVGVVGVVDVVGVVGVIDVVGVGG